MAVDFRLFQVTVSNHGMSQTRPHFCHVGAKTHALRDHRFGSYLVLRFLFYFLHQYAILSFDKQVQTRLLGKVQERSVLVV